MSGSLIGAILAGVVLTLVAFAHTIGPALMLAAITPFDAIPFALFGTAGNLITYVPVVIFLIKLNPALWGQAFLGTRVQQVVALFVILLVISHVQSVGVDDRGIGVLWDWLRKVTLFLLMGVFAWSLRDARHLALFVKVGVVSMAVFVVLSALDFYLGIQLLPVKAGLLEGAALDIGFESYRATQWRFTGPGFPVNRFSNYLLLTIFLALGWLMSERSTFQRAIALASTLVLVVGELLTVTRSGILGMGVGVLVVMQMVFRFRPAQIIGLVLIGGAFGAATWYVLGVTSGTEVLATRFDPANVEHGLGGRINRVLAAFQIWASHPFLGTGWGMFQFHSIHYVSHGGLGAHNGYTNVLAEAGLIGFVPLMIVTVVVLRRYLGSVKELSAAHEFWRPFFLAGLIAQLTTNVFNDYLWERYLWVNFAFAAVLEMLVHAERARIARQNLEQIRGMTAWSGADPSSSTEPSPSPEPSPPAPVRS